jgi:hypothetical protein
MSDNMQGLWGGQHGHRPLALLIDPAQPRHTPGQSDGQIALVVAGRVSSIQQQQVRNPHMGKQRALAEFEQLMAGLSRPFPPGGPRMHSPAAV